LATGKTYYWLKLRESFMTSDAVDFLMGQQDGANYVVLYQMLCLKTINTDGKLSRKLGEVIIPYDEAKIARDCKWFSIDTIRVALNLYKALGLIYVDTDGVLVMAKHNEMVGRETDYAAQKRLAREKTKALPQADTDNGVDSSVDIVHTEIEYRDKSIEIRDKIKEKDVDILREDAQTHTPTGGAAPAADKGYRKGREGEPKQPPTRFFVPTVEQIQAYCSERNNGIDAERFFDYYSRQGWRLSNNKPMKDWQAAVRTWERNNNKREAQAVDTEVSKGRNLTAAEIDEMEGTY